MAKDQRIIKTRNVVGLRAASLRYQASIPLRAAQAGAGRDDAPRPSLLKGKAMNVRLKLDHFDFRELVSGRVRRTIGTDDQGHTVTVDIALADIGFDVMKAELKSAIETAVRTRKR